MISYSIIIPHYNTPDLLIRCLKSIPQREDIQIIVVDDYSNKNTIDRINGMKQKFPQVTFLYSEKNGGAGAARNIGLKHAYGKWVLFADADDYFLNEAFPIFDSHLNDEKDAILFGNKSVSSKDKINTRGNFINDNINYYKKNLISSQLAFLCTWVPWAKMIKLNFIRKNDFKFEEIKYGNDVFWNAQIVAGTEMIAIFQDPVYAITQEEKSLTTNRDRKAFRIRYNAFKNVNQYLKKHNKTYLTQAITLEFAAWAREIGLLFYIIFLFNSIKENLIFEGQKQWITFAKINRNFLCLHPTLFLFILFFTPSYLLKIRRK